MSEQNVASAARRRRGDRHGSTRIPDVADTDALLNALPRHDDVARRAYELYEQRGCVEGRDWDDWFQAERELREAAQDRYVFA